MQPSLAFHTAIVIILLSIGYWFVNDLQEIICKLATYCVFAIVIDEAINRVIMLFELKHLASRMVAPATETTLSLLIASFVMFNTFKPFAAETWSNFAVFLAFRKFEPLMQLKNAPIYKSKLIAKPNEVDVGAYMAIAFFHGYLKVLLPQHPSNNRGLEYLMDIYEATHKIKFPRKVLYILVPTSMHCPHRLTDVSQHLEEASPLMPIEEDRAGVRDRSYRNSVYKIRHQGKPIYVVAEYASPLKTFWESKQTNDDFKEYYKLHKPDVLMKFYNTIVHLVREDLSTRGLAEFIYYEDFDARGQAVDISTVLLKRLEADCPAPKQSVAYS